VAQRGPGGGPGALPGGDRVHRAARAGEGTAWIRSATLEEAALRYDEAAAAWTSYGHQLERAHALLGAGRCLLALGRPEGQLRLREARTVVATLHAGALLSEADAP
jgi:hypothetical protein